MAAGTACENRGDGSGTQRARPAQRRRRRVPLIELALLAASMAVCAAFVLGYVG
ncbi:hypothetical protein VQ042_12660 [Aurantimonas sp. A2-1-M11]|uniref:hypothetical protein n=1 Tax=Aurantimonas sp. A2-1-M11 TaxID=3113712 RepID=UPI002F925CAE